MLLTQSARRRDHVKGPPADTAEWMQFIVHKSHHANSTVVLLEGVGSLA